VVRSALLGLILVFTGAAVGCSIKRTVNIPVPERKLQAKTATLTQLLAMLEEYSSKIVSLSSTTMRISFTSGTAESGKLQEYRSAPGYILLERPDRIRLDVQNPLTKTTIIDLASSGDDFSIWYPRENKFFIGNNSVRELDTGEGLTFSARPIHIFEAVLPQEVPSRQPGFRISMQEDQDSQAKYYVLSMFTQESPPFLKPLRTLWIDRSNLAVARQVTYGDAGAVASSIWYSNLSSVQGLPLPLRIRIERPLDGYLIDLEFRSWNLNPQLPKEAFQLTPPAGAQRIILKPKERSSGD
jgi:outer membrane lipoprotein-sorting protein